MINFKAYKLPSGLIDWKGYNEAQKAIGEACYKCGVEFLDESSTGKRLCSNCESLSNLSIAVQHEEYIRCPHCGNQERIFDWDDRDCGDVKYVEGSHEVTCSRCEKDYTIETYVNILYESPPQNKSG
jgi:DNA-directed RNA polymerase subunit RPC12/RpoP